MVMSLMELIDVVIMTVAVGFIFMLFIRRMSNSQPSPEHYLKKQSFDWDAFKMACLITAPALILHELGHKFVALAFGYTAIFHAAYGFLALGIVLRLMNSSFIFFVPAYVAIGCKTIGCAIQSLPHALIAAAGPFTNLALFAGAFFVLKYKKDLNKKTIMILHLTKTINIFLFIFNMLPIPGFDGSKVFAGLLGFF